VPKTTRIAKKITGKYIIDKPISRSRNLSAFDVKAKAVKSAAKHKKTFSASETGFLRLTNGFLEKSLNKTMPEKLKILVVDDNKEFCRNVRDILVELKNYQVMVAYDGFKDLKLVEQNSFDLVLMDVMMPGMDGVETFEKIKEVAQDTPVIMITAYDEGKLIREALRKGVFGYLKKPLDFDRFFSLLNR